jgi:hypothetical protein
MQRLPFSVLLAMVVLMLVVVGSVGAIVAALLAAKSVMLEGLPRVGDASMAYVGLRAGIALLGLSCVLFRFKGARTILVAVVVLFFIVESIGQAIPLVLDLGEVVSDLLVTSEFVVYATFVAVGVALVYRLVFGVHERAFFGHRNPMLLEGKEQGPDCA